MKDTLSWRVQCKGSVPESIDMLFNFLWLSTQVDGSSFLRIDGAALGACRFGLRVPVFVSDDGRKHGCSRISLEHASVNAQVSLQLFCTVAQIGDMWFCDHGPPVFVNT